MTLIREPGSNIVAQFTVPHRGTWKDTAIHTIPLDALYDSLNVFIKEGKLRNRPGLRLYDNTLFLEPVIGGAMVSTANEKVVLAVTKYRVYELSDLSKQWTFSVPTGSYSTMAPSDTSVVDVAFMESSGQVIAILAEENSPLKQWTSIPKAVSTITGTNIPKAKSICISASRVIALIPPHNVVWSGVNNPTVFDSGSIARRAQTGDMGICVESLSALSFVLYKERSIHLARAQAGVSESTAFSFFEPLYVEGPAGMYAVAHVGGAHIYMTKNGRIAVFDGSTYPQWIADGLWFFLQKDINPPFTHMIRAVYDYRLHTVTFFYPKRGTVGLMGMVTINLPFKGLDIAEPDNYKCFLGVCSKAIVHGCEMRWNSDVDRSILFSTPVDTQDRSQAYLYDEDVDLDEELPFTCMFQTGLQAMPDARHSHASVETFMERGLGYGSVVIDGVISDALENESGTIVDGTGQFIILEHNPVREYKAFGSKTRFFGLRYTWDSTTRVRYSGAVVYDSQGKV